MKIAIGSFVRSLHQMMRLIRGINWRPIGLNLRDSRPFSSSTFNNRIYAHVTVRKQKKPRDLQVGMSKGFLPKTTPKFPPYPYGDAVLFKQSNKGLYGGAMIQFGNKISEAKNRNRRTWIPNIHRHKLWSETLNRDIRIKTTARVLRTITKEGGIDRYLTKDKSARIKALGPTGWKLRYRVLQKWDRREKVNRKPAQVVELKQDGKTNKIPVYYNVTIPGTDRQLKLTVGRRKLMSTAFSVLKSDNSPDAVTYKHFVRQYSRKDVKDVIKVIDQGGFDWSQISIA